MLAHSHIAHPLLSLRGEEGVEGRGGEVREGGERRGGGDGREKVGQGREGSEGGKHGSRGRGERCQNSPSHSLALSTAHIHSPLPLPAPALQSHSQARTCKHTTLTSCVPPLPSRPHALSHTTTQAIVPQHKCLHPQPTCPHVMIGGASSPGRRTGVSTNEYPRNSDFPPPSLPPSPPRAPTEPAAASRTPA